MKYIQMTVDLLGLTVSLEQTPQNPHSADPHQLDGLTCIAGTLALTDAHVPSL